MKGRCSFCKETVVLYTVKLGDLFSDGEVYEICLIHDRKNWPMNKRCEGSDQRPEVIISLS
mgnify:CR=1 FL=1